MCASGIDVEKNGLPCTGETGIDIGTCTTEIEDVVINDNGGINPASSGGIGRVSAKVGIRTGSVFKGL